MDTLPDRLTIVVVGASGDLARKKIFPALFALYCQGFLPPRLQICGFARSKFSDVEFREQVTEHLTCRYVPGESCADRMEEFLGRCHYRSGDYGSPDSFLDLYELMREIEGGETTNRFYYLAIPPSVFLDVVRAIGDAGLVSCGSTEPWSRVVVEKPFGRDRQSSDELTHAMSQVFAEEQTFRIDHYLGKEVIQNLLVLRFANIVFQPLWNRNFIRGVEVLWRENIGTAGRGGYFDQYGIIRDVMQNHLMQILALVAMEPPSKLDSAKIAAEKARVLRLVRPPSPADFVVGQYSAAGGDNNKKYPGYVDDPGVPNDSLTPTYAVTRLQIDCPRWDGVPFVISAGKGVDAKMTEVRIHFRDVPSDMFCGDDVCPQANQLVIRVQPDEGILLSLMNKVPGMGMRLASRNLDLQLAEAFTELIPDAYESLLLDVIRGERSLFIRKSELAAAWDIFTPVLHEFDRQRVVPEQYAFGSQGPAAAEAFRL